MSAHSPLDYSDLRAGADDAPSSASGAAPRAAQHAAAYPAQTADPGSLSPLWAAGLTAAAGGAGLAWALAVVPSVAFHLVAAGGGAGLAVTVAAVAVAAQQWRSAGRLRASAGAAAGEAQELARRQERDFAELDRARGVAGLARRNAEAVAADLAFFQAEAARLAGETLPDAFGRLRGGEPADRVLAETARPASRALSDMLELALGEVGAAERQRATALASCASAAARIQAQATRMLAELREMEQRYGDDKVFADLAEIDHQASQMGRLADSIALLAGGRSGRRWTRPIPMESLLRGAMGRIDAYQRIRIHSGSTAAVAGYAAEGVMHALAELMDNATAFSTHSSEVHVYVEDEDVGIVITIEDSGLGMRRRERDRAEGLVTQSLDISTLPGTRLGLAVVGRVASRYGLTVSFRPSSRGGTGVVVMIPRALITQPRPQHESAGSAETAETAGSTPAASAAAEAADRGDALPPGEYRGYPDYQLDGDLPVRPRGRTLAAKDKEQAERPRNAAAARTPQETGSRFAAFRQSGRRTPDMAAGPAGPAGPADEEWKSKEQE
jgi:signal transduction histidine kinase